MSLKNSNDTIGNRTRELPVWSVVLVTNTSRLKRLSDMINKAPGFTRPPEDAVRQRNCVAMKMPAVNHAVVQTLFKQHTFD
jgi:hypothetical protein